MDEILLTEVAEEEGFDVADQMEVTKYLKLRVRNTAQGHNFFTECLSFRWRSWSIKRMMCGTDAMLRPCRMVT
jgi:hypothetical protein